MIAYEMQNNTKPHTENNTKPHTENVLTVLPENVIIKLNKFLSYFNGGCVMKKLLSLLLSFAMLMSITTGVDLSVYAAAQTGVCGDNVSWSLDDSGTLTVTGSGKMYDYTIDTCISDSPFENDKIKKVVIENGITYIGEFAFNQSQNLSSVKISSSVTDIADSAFNGCVKLSKLSVDSGNTKYSSVDGVLFNKAGTELIKYPIGNKATSYSVPNGVKTVGDNAFEYSSYLINIKIPGSVKTIGESAFGFSRLESITIPASVTEIEDYAFWNCPYLKSVILGRGISAVGDYTFDYCSRLEKVIIPEGIKSIGNNAFSMCTALESVILPNGVKSIGAYAFSSCKALKDITLPGSIKTVGASAFTGCNKLASVYYGGSKSDRKKISIENGNDILTKNSAYHYNSGGKYNGLYITLSQETYNYNGKKKSPKVAVINNSTAKTLKNGKDYTVSYGGNGKNVGKYAVTVKMKGGYKGTYKFYFTVKPKTAAVTDISVKNNVITVSWEKQTNQTSGYEIQFAQNSKFTNQLKTKTVSDNSATSVSFDNINPQFALNYYYFRVRTYKKVKSSGKTTKIYSSWSATERTVVKANDGAK